MGKVIGYIADEAFRTKAWLSMRNSKESYKLFSKSSDEQELQVADLDLRVYNHWMSKYLGVAA